ncbi:hypothetical protein [Luteipulveratus flavus]|uniref:Uncharacterized protein n=1 Tax=Luteipulveratus flavus TaxID=3031728 RepID=A0ABT6C338_9MICO|nr:hypothetical protein [Luteipulveratus sp. YIM 133296]MDF8263145.1 hypothetical protein [Luteipulveratus sp. YIM 133296]
MRALTVDSALEAGGWDPRCATVLEVRTGADIGLALIDPNGDGSQLYLDTYTRAAEGDWVASFSGSAGDEGEWWTVTAVACWGHAEPGQAVEVEYLGDRVQVRANAAGWWLFGAPPADDDTVPRRT